MGEVGPGLDVLTKLLKRSRSATGGAERGARGVYFQANRGSSNRAASTYRSATTAWMNW